MKERKAGVVIGGSDWVPAADCVFEIGSVGGDAIVYLLGIKEKSLKR